MWGNTQHKVSISKEILKTRAEINAVYKENNCKDQWNENMVLWKINKIDKTLAKLKLKREGTQMNKIKNEK